MYKRQHTHSVVSYLPDRAYLNDWMRVADLMDFFADFYADFDRVKANDMLQSLRINALDRLKTPVSYTHLVIDCRFSASDNSDWRTVSFTNVNEYRGCYSAAITSISTNASLGRRATSTAERAG